MQMKPMFFGGQSSEINGGASPRRRGEVLSGEQYYLWNACQPVGVVTGTNIRRETIPFE